MIQQESGMWRPRLTVARYHEEQVREAGRLLREGGQVIVVDVDRPADQHGIAPQLLFCEFARVGFRLVDFDLKPEIVRL